MAESPALKQWVIGKVSYDQEKVLGKGKHAVVYNGMFNWETAVAVKRIQIEFLKNEAILLKKIRDRAISHENLIHYYFSEKDNHFL